MKGWSRIYYALSELKKLEIAVMIITQGSSKKALKIKSKRDKQGNYIMLESIINNVNTDIYAQK